MSREVLVGRSDDGSPLVVDTSLQFRKSGVIAAALAGAIVGAVGVSTVISNKTNEVTKTLNSFKAEAMLAMVGFEALIDGSRVSIIEAINAAISGAGVAWGAELSRSLGSLHDDLLQAIRENRNLIDRGHLTSEEAAVLLDGKIAPILSKIEEFSGKNASVVTKISNVEEFMRSLSQSNESASNGSVEKINEVKNLVQALYDLHVYDDTLAQILTQIAVNKGLIEEIKSEARGSITNVFNDLFSAMSRPSDSAFVGGFVVLPNHLKFKNSTFDSDTIPVSSVESGQKWELVAYKGRIYVNQKTIPGINTTSDKEYDLAIVNLEAGFESLKGCKVKFKKVLKAENKFSLRTPNLLRVVGNDTGIVGVLHYENVTYTPQALYGALANAWLDYFSASHDMNDMREATYTRSLSAPSDHTPGRSYVLNTVKRSSSSAGVSNRDIISAAVHRSMADDTYLIVLEVTNE